MILPQWLTHLFLISGLTLIPTIAQAKYVPPPQQERAGDYSKSTGVRTGSTSQEDIPLTILAPQIYVGQTTSLSPTFVWVVGNNNTDYDIDFRLFEFTEAGDIKQRGNPLKFQHKGGLITLAFPPNQMSLTVGNKYLWQVSIRLSNSNWMIQKAEFTVVPISTNLSQTLTQLKTEEEKAEIYAENGLWYDALAESLNINNKDQSVNVITDLVKSLAESEVPSANDSLTLEEQQFIEKRLNYLRQINFSILEL
jgi:hypothetical protein